MQEPYIFPWRSAAMAFQLAKSAEREGFVSTPTQMHQRLLDDLLPMLQRVDGFDGAEFMAIVRGS